MYLGSVVGILDYRGFNTMGKLLMFCKPEGPKPDMTGYEFVLRRLDARGLNGGGRAIATVGTFKSHQQAFRVAMAMDLHNKFGDQTFDIEARKKRRVIKIGATAPVTIAAFVALLFGVGVRASHAETTHHCRDADSYTRVCEFSSGRVHEDITVGGESWSTWYPSRAAWQKSYDQRQHFSVFVPSAVKRHSDPTSEAEAQSWHSQSSCENDGFVWKDNACHAKADLTAKVKVEAAR
jgi:hypothetical protein